MQTPDTQKALDKLRQLCSRQEKCKADAYQKLRQWGIEPHQQEAIVERLEEEQFINETRYSAFFVKDKIRFNKWGKKKVEMVLQQKNISQAFVQQALEKIDQSAYQQMIEAEIRKKYQQAAQRETDSYRLKAKILRFAQSRGYETELVLPFLENLIAEEE